MRLSNPVIQAEDEGRWREFQ